MIPDNYQIITGLWPVKVKTPEGFFTRAGIEMQQQEGFQLFQTFSECRIDFFSPGTKVEINYLEQYRAFCPEWELWIRNINSEYLRFRFMLRSGPAQNLRKKFSDDGWEMDHENCKLQGSIIKTVTYPLWGEPVQIRDEEKDLKGWYTRRIPGILDYPLDFPGKNDKQKACLKVENFLRPDGAVELVKYNKMTIGD